MAGNIIPAIATTNAIIAGGIVLQALRLLKKEYTKMRNVYLQVKPENPLSGSIVGGPAKGCAVCGVEYTDVLVNPGTDADADAANGAGDESMLADVTMSEAA